MASLTPAATAVSGFPFYSRPLKGEREKREKSRSPETGQNGKNGNAVEVRTSCAWLIHWLAIEPTTKRYREPVTLARVLSEHHAAVAAEPLGD
ncbi:hypothetical protein AZOA_07340 [Azoarcus sp. Aa7]|nr:hypothetical protein [Azoarcus sp. Aa7]